MDGLSRITINRHLALHLFFIGLAKILSLSFLCIDSRGSVPLFSHSILIVTILWPLEAELEGLLWGLWLATFSFFQCYILCEPL